MKIELLLCTECLMPVYLFLVLHTGHVNYHEAFYKFTVS